MDLKMFIVLFLILGCQTEGLEPGELKSQIEETERAFAQMASEAGIHEAFLKYAADEAILIRNSRAVEGKPAIAEYFSQHTDEGQTLVWEPRKIEVALSGDLAYSFGDFTFTQIDSAGINQTLKGNFCTIWKRQPDGKWKFVVD